MQWDYSGKWPPVKSVKIALNIFAVYVSVFFALMKVVLMIHDWFIVLVFSEEDNNFKEVG